MKNKRVKVASVNKKRVFGYKFSQRTEKFFAYLLLTVFSIIVVFPIFWIAMTSLKERVLIYQIPPVWFFKPTLEAYKSIMVKYPFPKYFFNSTLIALVTTGISLVLGSLTAFSIARFKTGGTSFKLWILNSHTMPAVAVLIPFFMLAIDLNIRNTYLVVILTHLSFLLPFTIWILIGFFESIPKEIEEAALVDGATNLQSLWYITLRIAAPGLSAAGIVSFLFSWNEFIFALVLTGNNTRTLPVAISAFLTQKGVLMGELSAATMVMIVPVMILSIIFRNHLVKGLSLGAIK
jgi:multiple sugar transport system permease protein